MWIVKSDGVCYALKSSLSGLCAGGVDSASTTVAEALLGAPLSAGELQVLAPIDPHQEVWAAGVTYERSRTARIEESGERHLYSYVYDNARPELFFKSVGSRVVGPEEAIGIRKDALWSVPEPELGVVLDRDGRTLGFVVGDDVSSRDIEGTNALYLPQAKVYDKSCALGSGIVPAWELPEQPTFAIELQIARGGETIFTGATSTTRLRRHWSDLSQWLRASLSFPDGVVLLTGTGVVPDDGVTLQEGDGVVINISNVGTLRNRVETVGRRVSD